MRICIISDNKNSYSSRKFIKEASLKNMKIQLVPWKFLRFDSKKTGFFVESKTPLSRFDAVILRSSKNALTSASLVTYYCRSTKIRLLNENFYLKHSYVSKLRQQLIFQNEKIACLRSLYGENLSYQWLRAKLGSPFVAKLANSSLGKGVFKISSREDFSKFIKKRKTDHEAYLFQKFYRTDGDYRVFIVGKRAFGPVKRIAKKGEWRTNIRGARYERAKNGKKILKLASDFAKKTGIEFAGIDILIDSCGKPRIIEINTMAGFKVFDSIYPEINIAKKTLELLGA